MDPMTERIDTSLSTKILDCLGMANDSDAQRDSTTAKTINICRKIGLGVCLAGVVIAIAGIATASLPFAIVGIAFAVTGAALAIFSGKTPKVEKKNELWQSDVELLGYKKIAALEMSNEIHELCEIDVKGNEIPCTLERLTQIVNELKEKKYLHILNTIPKYFERISYRERFCYTSMRPLGTPLQYWSAKGNLQAVKILFEKGAADFCKEGSTSALYAASLHGHIEIVKYLLASGAHADIAFHNNIYVSFVPKLVFDIIRMHDGFEDALACLRLVLTNLKNQNQQSLEVQLRVPISRTKNDINHNCLDYCMTSWVWMCDLDPDRQAELADKLADILKSFGGSEGNAYSTAELHDLALRNNVTLEGGFNLHDETEFK